MELQKGRPKDTAGRLEKEIRTYDLLDKLGVAYERVDHAPAMTMEVCQEIDKVLQATICKKSFPVQSSGNQVLFIDDSRYKGIPHKGFVCQDRLCEIILCKARVHGEIFGYHTGFRQRIRTDERYRKSRSALN